MEEEGESAHSDRDKNCFHGPLGISVRHARSLGEMTGRPRLGGNAGHARGIPLREQQGRKGGGQEEGETMYLASPFSSPLP